MARLPEPEGPSPARLFLLAYSLCLARFFAAITTLSPAALPLPIFAPPKLRLCAPILDRVLPPEVMVVVAEASRCDANLAITFDREMRGLRPGSTFGLGGMGGFCVSDTAADPRDGFGFCGVGLRG